MITCVHATHCRRPSLPTRPTSRCNDVLRGQAGPWPRVRAVHAPHVRFPKAVGLQEAAENRWSCSSAGLTNRACTVGNPQTSQCAKCFATQDRNAAWWM